MSEILVMWLDVLRRAWGEPIIVNSGWRCGPRNLKVGGAVASRHLIGCAADIAPFLKGVAQSAGGLPPPFQRFTALAERLCRNPGWEFLPYPTFIHVAAPREESARRWNGGKTINI